MVLRRRDCFIFVGNRDMLCGQSLRKSEMVGIEWIFWCRTYFKVGYDRFTPNS